MAEFNCRKADRVHEEFKARTERCLGTGEESRRLHAVRKLVIIYYLVLLRCDSVSARRMVQRTTFPPRLLCFWPVVSCLSSSPHCTVFLGQRIGADAHFMSLEFREAAQADHCLRYKEGGRIRETGS